MYIKHHAVLQYTEFFKTSFQSVVLPEITSDLFMVLIVSWIAYVIAIGVIDIHCV